MITFQRKEHFSKASFADSRIIALQLYNNNIQPFSFGQYILGNIYRALTRKTIFSDHAQTFRVSDIAESLQVSNFLKTVLRFIKKLFHLKFPIILGSTNWSLTPDQVNNRKGLQNLLSYSVNPEKRLGSTFSAVFGGQYPSKPHQTNFAASSHI